MNMLKINDMNLFFMLNQVCLIVRSICDCQGTFYEILWITNLKKVSPVEADC